jgi:hypothetical protein
MQEIKKEKKVILDGEFEEVVQIEDHYYLRYKKDTIAVLPYTLDVKLGLLDKIGIIEDWNYIENEKVLTLINDYISTDDSTDLVAANRILFEIIGTNIKDALNWMYLGSIYNNMSSDSTIKLYAVDITNIKIKSDEDVEEKEDRKKFKMLSSERVIQTDDMLFLASFLRLLNYFYISSLSNNAKKI